MELENLQMSAHHLDILKQDIEIKKYVANRTYDLKRRKYAFNRNWIKQKQCLVNNLKLLIDIIPAEISRI